MVETSAINVEKITQRSAQKSNFNIDGNRYKCTNSVIKGFLKIN